MMASPTVTTAAFAALEKVINTALKFDPGTEQAIAQLQGNILALDITVPELTCYVLPQADGLRIQSYMDESSTSDSITTRLRGTLPALCALASTETTSLAQSGVEVSGSTAFLNKLQAIMRGLDLDWEEVLAQPLGDIVGHELARGVRAAAQWFGGRAKSGQRLFGEYLTEELRILPSHSELNEFYHQVDELRLEVDRFNLRVKQLVEKCRQSDLFDLSHKES